MKTKKIFLFSISMIFLFALDIYIFQGFSDVFHGGLSLVGSLGYWVISLLVILAAFSIGWQKKWPLNSKLLNPSFLLTGVLVIYLAKGFFMFSIIADDFRRVVLWVLENADKVMNGNEGGAIADRSDLSPKLGLLAAAIPTSALTYGVTVGAHDYKVTRKKIPIKNLPKDLDGLKIGHFSDIHAGSLNSKKGVSKGIYKLMKEQADLIFFTGDLVNSSAHEVDDLKEIFSMVEAPLGVYSILGNHDYGHYRKWHSRTEREKNFEQVKNLHEEFGWKLLLNDHQIIQQGEGRIGVIGVENWGSADRMPKKGNIKSAKKGMQKVDVNLLLSHDPSHWSKKVIPYHPDIDITFSGHTHGMQFGVHNRFIKWSPVKYVQKHWSGLYKIRDQYLYVNRGFGHHGFPGRIGMPPEITIIELKQA